MRVLLTTLNAKYIHSNLAIRLLYALNKEHKGLEWKEYTIKQNRDDIAEECKIYDLIAFSCYIWNITPTLELARKIKKLNPAIKILLGGPEVTYEWEEVLKKEEVDFIVIGEGEIPFTALLKNFPETESVPGLAYKKNGELFQNPAPANFDLAQYVEINPYEYDAPETLASRVLYVETSRGCPYKCEFCLASLDNKVRYLPMQNIKATLLYLMQQGRVIKFLDRTFNIKKDFTLEIFQFILDNYSPGNVFQFEITADILHPDIIQFIHEKVPENLFRFEIGIQSVNQKANLAVSRKQNFEKTKKIIQSLQNKVEMHLDLIVGLPYDEMNDVKYSFEEVFKLFAPELQLGFLKFLKGTTMRDKEEHGYVFDPEPPYQLIRSKYLSQEELDKITALEHALEIYWNKKRASHLLKYVTGRYSIFDFLMNLGVYFGERRDYHAFSLMDVYEIAGTFIGKNYPEDPIMKQMLSIDYYLSSKVRPGEFILPVHTYNEEVTTNKKARFVSMNLSFDYFHFNKNNEVIQKQDVLEIRYTGISEPEIRNKPTFA